ncbi:hypothetical protein EZV62_020876 [Acer yangbiense]|uniref:Uncharacterized protein n=1 Tax=Acer yangbiense TaxID=1000413 RepID=A0A5C7HF13_9ROSI|nr:hypothetical protein EZV62_020876 [Acer yangbiense]
MVSSLFCVFRVDSVMGFEDFVNCFGFSLQQYSSWIFRVRSKHIHMEGQQAQHCKVDRLTNLPDPIIHHILSLMDTKYAVRTCILSSKWRYHWRGIHSLHFDFPYRVNPQKFFGRFVSLVLDHRRPSNLRRLTFYFRGCQKTQPHMKRIFKYAISNGVEELETHFKTSPPPCDCETLRTLELHDLIMPNGFPSSFGFTSLTTLQLYRCLDVSLNNVFSNCLNLENLHLIECSMNNLSISAPNLIKLFISRFNYFNNFHPKHIKGKIAIESAPRLEFVDFSADQHMELSIHECPKLDKVNIRMPPPVAWRETNSYSNSYRFDVIYYTFSPEFVFQDRPSQKRILRATKSIYGFSMELRFGKVIKVLLNERGGD